ncbi:alpha/beta fold hydrolase [Isobaculum melis]|uniref:Uncharacterized protein with an alpha/beta hydrolase fold n=1 Tax=Isobaculum melis TaxID=142588 RepID=A0A1H9PQ71_9LACT|nr:alpha/beta fold hydrolase [Isobaculum melis]SER49945.1 Uncharacterized protein with an alpha/beta hydrolase fold [Isobaculum melis]
MKKKIIIGLLALLIVVGATVFWLTRPPKIGKEVQNAIDKEEVIDSNIPTVFMHGYAGTKNSLGKMIERFDESGVATKGLILTMKKDGTIEATGELDTTKKNPTIQFIYEDSRVSVEDNILWLVDLMKELKSNYGIETIHFVGHSLGGVAGLYYLEEHASDAHFPHIQKFVAIGSPFNGLYIADDGVSPYDFGPTGPQTETERFTFFKENKEKIPADTHILNIAGDVEDGTKSDESVAVSSALSIRFMLNPQHYQEKVFYGAKAQHSALHENDQVDAEVLKFLWSNNQ